MKQLLLIIACCIAVVANGQIAKVTDYEYGHTIKEAIRDKAGTRDISFGWTPTYQKETPPVYEQKWEIKINGYTFYGYAKVRYNGGNPKDLASWTVLKSYIDK